MKKNYLLLIAGFYFFTASAQVFEWARVGGSWAYDHGFGITLDASGNVYIAGKYELNADFSGIILPDRGNHDIYVAKYSPNGDLQWVRSAGGSGGDYALAVCSDGSGIYVAGEIEGYGNTITFEGSSATLTCVGDNDMFLAKYDLNGNLLWVIREGWIYGEKALGVTADNSGNVYVCGYYKDTTDVGGNKLYSKGYRDVLLAKYDMNGKFQWVRHAGGIDRDEAKSVKCDAAGNVYITGLYNDGAVFGPYTLSGPPGYSNFFLAKYSPDGDLLWVRTAGDKYDDAGWSMAIDNAGRIYVTGEFNPKAVFGNTTLITTGEANVFVACYDGSGNVLWAVSGGGEEIDRARGMGCDGTNIYITGQFGVEAKFGPHTVTGQDSSEIFVAALTNTGDFMWAVAVGGQVDSVEELSFESGNAVCADASGNVYATGSLLSGGTFGNIAVTPFTRTDVFLTRISQSAISVKDNKPDPGSNRLYPNPGNGIFTLSLDNFQGQKAEVFIYDYLGQLLERKIYTPSNRIQLSIPDSKTGVYFVEVRDEVGSILREKLIIN